MKGCCELKEHRGMWKQNMGRNRDAVHIGARAAEQSSSEQGVPECVRVSVLHMELNKSMRKAG